MYNYVVSAHKPSAVTHALTGHFTSPDDMNLILRYSSNLSTFVYFANSKCTLLEIYKMTADGIVPMLEVPIYGRIATIQLFRPPVIQS